MIYLFLAGLGVWLLIGLLAGWTALAFAVGGFLAVMFGFVFLDFLYHRRHRYDAITPSGRKRVGIDRR